jgi:hypothetical protein
MRPVDSRISRVPNGYRGKTDSSCDGRSSVNTVQELLCNNVDDEERSNWEFEFQAR